jgi:hypothetical protein
MLTSNFSNSIFLLSATAEIVSAIQLPRELINNSTGLQFFLFLLVADATENVFTLVRTTASFPIVCMINDCDFILNSCNMGLLPVINSY